MTVLVVAGALYANVSKAQTDKTQNDDMQMDTVSTNFIMKASVGGMKEVETGKLAETKGQSSSIRTYGAKMVADHSKANAKLMKIAKAEHYNMVTPPSSVTAPDPMLVQSSNADFDKMYIKMMIMDHEKTIAIFQNAADNAVDTEIKAFAVQTLPTLKQHLAQIKTIAMQMGVATN